MQSLTSIRRDLRALVQARDYAQIDAYYDALEQRDWADTEDPGAPYFEAANSGTLFDYSMVPFQDAAAFLQDWIAASPARTTPIWYWAISVSAAPATSGDTAGPTA